MIIHPFFSLVIIKVNDTTSFVCLIKIQTVISYLFFIAISTIIVPEKMAKPQDIIKRLKPGHTVKLETEEGEFEGLFKQIEDGLDGREIQLVKCFHMGKEQPGIQSFAFLDIESIVSPSLLTCDTEDMNNLAMGDIKVNENNVVTAAAANGYPAKFNTPPKSKPKAKDRPVICKARKKNIADISHLDNLHLLRMPELLNQVQMEDAVPLQSLMTEFLSCQWA